MFSASRGARRPGFAAPATRTGSGRAVTRISRRNLPYAFGVIWALLGIAAANAMGEPSPAIVVVALGAALLVGGALVSGRGSDTGRAVTGA